MVMNTNTTNQTAATKKAKTISVAQQSAAQLTETIQKWNLDRMRRAVEQFMLWDMHSIDGTIQSRTGDGKIYFAEQTVPIKNFGVMVHVGCDCDDQKQHINRLERRAAELGMTDSDPVHCKHYYIRLLLDGMALSYCGARIQVPQTLRQRHLK